MVRIGFRVFHLHADVYHVHAECRAGGWALSAKMFLITGFSEIPT
jgi:hypothetical protein